MTNGSTTITGMAYDAVRVKLRQPRRRYTPGLYSVNKHVYILTVAYPIVSPHFDICLMYSYP